MVEVMSVAPMRARRQPLMVDGFTKTTRPEDGYFITSYLGALPATVERVSEAERCQPQAYLVEQPAFAEVPPHYHDTNQFQVFVRGRVLFGKHRIGVLAVHYASGHTPYGPLITEDEGVHYFTLRNRWDSGGKPMPQSRPTLKPARRRYRMAEIDLKAAGAAQTAPYRTDVMSYEADGLGASLFRLPPQVESLAALPLAGAGLYALVIDGEVGFGGQRLLANSALYVGPGQTLGRIVAGPHGATFLMVQFPPDLT